MDTTGHEFRQVLNVNLIATFALARAAARSMVTAGNGGRLINLGSLFGQQAVSE